MSIFVEKCDEKLRKAVYKVQILWYYTKYKFLSSHSWQFCQKISKKYDTKIKICVII